MRAAGGAIVLLAVLGMLFASGQAAAQGIVWSKLSVDEALAKAKEQNRVLMIDVFSDHCMQCKDLDEQLWQTADGAALGEDLIALQIESDGPGGERLRRLYPVLGLPVVIFIEPDGKEIGRVVGFRGLAEFLTEARNLKAGVDPLPALEAELAAHPDGIPQLVDVMEQYLFRKREAEGKQILDKLIALDAKRQSSDVTRAMALMGKYYENVDGDWEASLGLWKSMVQLYPRSAGATSGISGSCKIAVAWNQTREWIDWICAIGDQYPEEGRLHYNIAMIAYRQGLKDDCLARSARTAIAKGVGPSNMDSIAVVLEGTR